MMEDKPPISYASPPDARRPLSGNRAALLCVGVTWFAMATLAACGVLALGGFGQRPVDAGSDADVLRVAGWIMAVGLPGLVLAVAALRFRR